MTAAPDVEVLRSLLSYDPSAGVLTWRPRTPDLCGGSVSACANFNAHIAGHRTSQARNAKGYLEVRIFGRQYKAHRVAWALHYGAWPKGQIDHLSGDKTDNRIENLRECSAAQNSQNKAKFKGDLPKGVCRKGPNRFSARIDAFRKTHWLGAYATQAEAALAYDMAAVTLHGEFARTNESGAA